jgi:hypothetical protein
MTRPNNLYLLMIFQAILTLILLFSESYVKYIAITLFCLIDIIMLFMLLRRSWGASEVFSLATFFYSLLFLMFYLFVQSAMSKILGIGLMLLFLLSALLVYEPQAKAPKKLPELAKPRAIDNAEKYDMDKFEKELDQELMMQRKPAKQETRHEAKPIIKSDDSKFRARALAYELEREAAELKRAEAYVRKKETSHAETELEREADELEKADYMLRQQQTSIDTAELEREAVELNNAEHYLELKDIQSKESELAREASELKKASSFIKSRTKDVKKKELTREAKRLEGAEKQIKQVNFLNKQEQVINEARRLAQAQKKIDELKKSPKKKFKKSKR